MAAIFGSPRLTQLFTLLVKGFTQDRQTVDNPPVNCDFQRHEANNDKEFFKTEKFPFRYQPVEGNQGHVKPVNDNPENSQRRRKPDQSKLVITRGDDKKNTG